MIILMLYAASVGLIAHLWLRWREGPTAANTMWSILWAGSLALLAIEAFR